jgi:signal transduction histidine kinase
VRFDRHGDGVLETFYFNFVYAPLRGLDGRVEGVLVTAFDITDEIRAREQMRQLRLEAESANRAKDQFLAMLSHELRNPLAPVVTALRLLRHRGHQSSELEILERQTSHLTRLVDDLLDVSRITCGKIELRRSRIELAQAVDKALEIANPLLEHGRHAVHLHGLPHEGLAVEADPHRLAQIIANLLTNAAKYSEAGRPVTLHGRHEGGRVHLVVRDQGVGIEPDMLERVFDPFTQRPQTIERSQGGLGLGLAIARNLAQLHGGSLSARSAGPGHGSEFELVLPGAGAPAPAAPPVQGPEASAAGGRRILMIDDNVDAALSMHELLKLLGHEVQVAHTGAAALDRAQAFLPEIALVDIGLPDIDGYEVARHLRELRPEGLLLVAVTGYGLPADRERSALAGFRHHLVKPIDLGALGALRAAPPT